MKNYLFIILALLLLSDCSNGKCGKCVIPVATPSPTVRSIPPVKAQLNSPIKSSINAGVNPQIELSFNIAMLNVNANSVTLYESSPTGTAIPLILESENKGTDFIFQAENLKLQTQYYVVASNAISCAIDNCQFLGEMFSFTTENSIQAISIIPANNGEANINVTQILLKFPYDIISTSVTMTNINLTTSGNNANLLSKCYLSDPQTITCNFGALFPGVNYYINAESIQLTNGYNGVVNSTFQACTCPTIP